MFLFKINVFFSLELAIIEKNTQLLLGNRVRSIFVILILLKNCFSQGKNCYILIVFNTSAFSPSQERKISQQRKTIERFN